MEITKEEFEKRVNKAAEEKFKKAMVARSNSQSVSFLALDFRSRVSEWSKEQTPLDSQGRPVKALPLKTTIYKIICHRLDYSSIRELDDQGMETAEEVFAGIKALWNGKRD